MIVELHILQNFAPSNLNRDDTNSPKECQFGGYRRARISSQCIKRAIRTSSVFEREVESRGGIRTKKLIPELAKRLKGGEDGALTATISKVFDEGGVSSDADGRTDLIFFMDEAAIADIVDVLKVNLSGLEKDDKASKDRIISALADILASKVKVPDIALFGRMLAIKPDKPLGKKNLNVDAACQVAHAISTHKVGVEFDFYTAVDDLQPEGETGGAGMIGDIEFNSACYYRYANINMEQLKANLGGDGKLAGKTIEAFIRAAVAAVPTGKQTSFAAQNPADFVLAVVRDSGTWSLANAFSRPVKDGGDLMTDSIDALVKYWGRLNTAYPPAVSMKAKPAFCLTDNDLPGLDRKVSIDELVAAVRTAIAS